MQTMTETTDSFIPYLRFVIYMQIFYWLFASMSWRSGSDDGLSIRRMWVRVQVIASFFFFNVFFFFFFFFNIIITVRFQH